MTNRAIIFQPNIEIPPGSTLPDPYDRSYGLIPPDELVVSRNRDGSVASMYASYVWILTAYEPQGRPFKLYFANWCKDAPTEAQARIIDDMHWVMFFLIWKRNGSPLSVSSLDNYMKLVTELAKFANESSCDFNDVLRDPSVLRRYLDWNSGPNIRTLASLLKALLEQGDHEVGFRVLGGITLKELRDRQKEYEARYKQHPPIPTRIYSKLIAILSSELSDFEAISERYLGLMAECLADPMMGRNSQQQSKVAKRQGGPFTESSRLPTFGEMLIQYDLMSYWNSKNLQTSLKGLLRGLTNIQLVCKLLIHSYSGMRHNEVLFLPYDCLNEFKNGGKTHYRILGTTTKLNGGRIKRTSWVTSPEGARAIRTAQEVALAIFRANETFPAMTTSRINDYPLFVSTGYLPFASRRPSSDGRKFISGRLAPCFSLELRGRLDIPIEEQDLHELEQIDPHRNWRGDPKFQLGRAWHLTTHQLRRSLALYASRSGLVSLPSLRRQLQHVTEEMSRYYALGSVFAKDIIGEDKEHFGREYQNIQPESQALSYIANVLLSDERLFGTHGMWIERNYRKLGKALILEEREKTISRFKKGEIAYKETNLGGCTEILPCDKRAMRSLIDCLECKRSVVNLSKLDRVIAAQEAMVRKLAANTIEWDAENKDLKILISARKKFSRQQNAKGV